MYVCVGEQEKGDFFSSETRTYLQAGTQRFGHFSVWAQSHMTALFQRRVNGSGRSYSYYGILIIGKEMLCGQPPSILLKLIKSLIEDLLIFEHKARAERPLLINL